MITLIFSQTHLVKFYFELHGKYSPTNSTHFAKLYPQNGERVVNIDSVTSFHPEYTSHSFLSNLLFWYAIRQCASKKINTGVLPFISSSSSSSSESRAYAQAELNELLAVARMSEGMWTSPLRYTGRSLLPIAHLLVLFDDFKARRQNIF